MQGDLTKQIELENALYKALDFLEELPAPPVDIIEEIHKALEIEF